MPTQKLHLLDYDLDGLTAQLSAAGLAPYRAKQIFQWIYEKGATTFAAMSNLSLGERQFLDESYVIFASTVTHHQTAADGTQKLLLTWADGLATETVLIPADTDVPDSDDKPSGHPPTARTIRQRRTVCLSTQVGCPVRCAFCASGLEGLQRNLTAGEVVEQALQLRRTLPAGERISNVVFMGMGEPLANFEVTVQAVKTLMAPWGLHIGGRKITVSTVGLPPQMGRLAETQLPVTLAISLHAPNDALRQQIIPWAKGIGMEKIVAAGREYFDKTGREITLEYIMLAGVNTLPEHAHQLAGVALQLRANVNLIYYNEVPELPYQRPAGSVMLAFQQVLRAGGVNAHVRKSRGRDIAAACGQLARQETRRSSMDHQRAIPVNLTVHAQ